MAPFSTFIARRYFGGRRGMFVSFLSAIAVASVAMGVFAMVVVLSVMLGFSRDLEQRLMGFNAHLVVESANTGDFDGVVEALSGEIAQNAIIVEGEGIARTVGSSDVLDHGVRIRGMDESQFSALRGVEWYGEPGAMPGSELSYEMGVHPDYGDKIELVAPLSHVGPAGELIPERIVVPVTGMFRSGYFEHDSKTIIIPKIKAEKLLGLQATKALHVWLNKKGHAVSLANMLKEKFPSLRVFTWEETNRKLFSALRLERMAMTALLTLIVAIACVSIISVVFLQVFGKRKDTAILVSIGASDVQIRRIFIGLGGYIGFLGSVIGLLFGTAMCFYLAYRGIELPESYYLDRLPVDVSIPFLVVVGIGGIVLSMIAAIYPAWHASRQSPSEVLRYE